LFRRVADAEIFWLDVAVDELAVVESFQSLDHLVAKEKHRLETKLAVTKIKKLHQVRTQACHC